MLLHALTWKRISTEAPGLAAAQSTLAGFGLPWVSRGLLCTSSEKWLPSLHSLMALPNLPGLSLAVFPVSQSTRPHMPCSRVGGTEGKRRVEHILICRRNAGEGSHRLCVYYSVSGCHRAAARGLCYTIVAAQSPSCCCGGWDESVESAQVLL